MIFFSLKKNGSIYLVLLIWILFSLRYNHRRELHWNVHYLLFSVIIVMFHVPQKKKSWKSHFLYFTHLTLNRNINERGKNPNTNRRAVQQIQSLQLSLLNVCVNFFKRFYAGNWGKYALYKAIKICVKQAWMKVYAAFLCSTHCSAVVERASLRAHKYAVDSVLLIVVIQYLLDVFMAVSETHSNEILYTRHKSEAIEYFIFCLVALFFSSCHMIFGRANSPKFLFKIHF